MELNYQLKSGQLYAKVPGHSVRRNGKIIKTGVLYLGRVIDKEHNVFCNRERGIFTFDPETGTFGKADETYVSDLPSDHRRKEHTLLDFGDSFFVDSLLRSIGYDKVIESISYRNKDTVYAMVLYYILCSSANCHAATWLEGSYARILYPKANLTSQRITDFLESIGNWDKMNAFFDHHIEWVKNQCKDPAILVDSTGLPNSIHFPLTAVSSHNGKISNEVRMTTLLQRDTGYPLFFRVTPGNVIDLSTLTRSVNELYMKGINTDLIIVDAGYLTKDNIESLYFAKIDFLSRLPEHLDVYKQVVHDNLSSLQREENLVQYGGRYVYIKRAVIKVGRNGHTAYAYLGYDVDRADDEKHKALKRAAKDHLSTQEVHKQLQNTGLFVIICSLPYQAEEILPTYYIRQTIEQYFDIGKSSSRLIPLRVHSEEALYGHLILSMIAATINVYIQKKTDKKTYDRDEIFMGLRNQKCAAYKTRIATAEPVRTANEYYKTFGIKCPIGLARESGKLIPQYQLSEINKEDE